MQAILLGYWHVACIGTFIIEGARTCYLELTQNPGISKLVTEPAMSVKT